MIRTAIVLILSISLSLQVRQKVLVGDSPQGQKGEVTIVQSDGGKVIQADGGIQADFGNVVQSFGDFFQQSGNAQQSGPEFVQSGNVGAPQCSNVLSSLNGRCYNFAHCLYHQVTNDYTDYGCAICDSPNYELIEDANAAGYCVPKSAQTVSNCLYASKSIVFGNGNHVCYKCKDGYILSNNLRRCLPIRGNFPRIPFCLSYQFTNDNRVGCLQCSAGYRATENMLACEAITNQLEGCEAHATFNGQLKCTFCKAGYIGVFNPNNHALYYDACITCNTWQCKLLSQAAQSCCLSNTY